MQANAVWRMTLPGNPAERIKIINSDNTDFKTHRGTLTKMHGCR